LAPGVGAVGVDVFVLGEVEGLNKSLAQVGQGGGGFGFDLALGYGGEEASEGGAEIAGGEIAAGQVIGDVFAGFLASEGLGFLAGVEGAEVRMAGLARSAAAAAVDKGESTQRGTAFGAIGGNGSLQKEGLDFGIFWGASRGRGAVFYGGKCIREMSRLSINFAT
jgi:hypothetical protein